jgi:hypothetical protein
MVYSVVARHMRAMLSRGTARNWTTSRCCAAAHAVLLVATQTFEPALHFARRQQARASHASQQLHQHVIRAFSSHCQSVARLGDTLQDVDTPALLVDLDGG